MKEASLAPEALKHTLYFWDYKTHFPPPQIWEENGNASYSLNVAYLARSGEAGEVQVLVERGFFPIFLL